MHDRCGTSLLEGVVDEVDPPVHVAKHLGEKERPKNPGQAEKEVGSEMAREEWREERTEDAARTDKAESACVHDRCGPSLLDNVVDELDPPVHVAKQNKRDPNRDEERQRRMRQSANEVEPKREEREKQSTGRFKHTPTKPKVPACTTAVAPVCLTMLLMN